MEFNTNIDRYDFVVGFKSKGESKKFLTDQDKQHIRILSILKIAQEGAIEKILNNEFKEVFSFDEKNQMAYYKIRLIRKDGKKH